MVASPHGMPSIAARTLGDYAAALRRLEREAASDGLGTLAYLIAIAALEAEATLARAADAQAVRAREATDPETLWRPDPDR